MDLDTLKVFGPIVCAVLGLLAVMLRRKTTVEYRHHHYIDHGHTPAGPKKKGNPLVAGLVLVGLVTCCLWANDKSENSGATESNSSNQPSASVTSETGYSSTGPAVGE